MECKSFEHNQCVGLMLLKSLTLCILYIKSKCILWISPFICLVTCDLWAIFTAVFSHPIASHHESMSISWCYCGAKLPVYSMLNTYCRHYELKLMIDYVSGNLGSRTGVVITSALAKLTILMAILKTLPKLVPGICLITQCWLDKALN